MKIVVCVKQVPNTNEVRINKETGTLIRDGVPSIINPDDKNAIEAALELKEKLDDVTVIILSMGPPQAKLALKEAIAMGADKAILLSDRAFGGSDTWATATILAGAIEKVGNVDMILCGRQAIDGDTAQVGPEIAEFLQLPQVTYASEIEVKGKNVIVKRSTEDGYYIITSPMPVLLTCIKELNKPRYARPALIYKAFASDDNVEIWSNEDINVDLSQIGVKNSPTNVYRSFVPVREFHGEILKGSNKEVAAILVDKLHELKVL